MPCRVNAGNHPQSQAHNPNLIRELAVHARVSAPMGFRNGPVEVNPLYPSKNTAVRVRTAESRN